MRAVKFIYQISIKAKIPVFNVLVEVNQMLNKGGEKYFWQKMRIDHKWLKVLWQACDHM